MAKITGAIPASKSNKLRGKQHPLSVQPVTALEHLTLAVSHEEAAEKWRAGDAIKSSRFYCRSLTVYQRALSHLRNLDEEDRFDFEYNSARILLTIAESRALLNAFGKVVPEFPTLSLSGSIDVEGLLRAALSGFRRALGVKEEKDALFNLGQALGSLADELDDDRKAEKVSLLKEAAEALESCFRAQEEALTGNKALVEQWTAEEFDHSQEEDGGVSLVSGPGSVVDDDEEPKDASSSAEGAQWASVQEAVTAATLVDTAIALLEVLEALVDIAREDQNTLATAEALSNKLIHEKLPRYVTDAPDTKVEAAIAVVRLQASLLEAAFRSGRLDVHSYLERLQRLFEGDAQMNDVQWLVTYADSLVDFSTALGEVARVTAIDGAATQRWNRLSKALELLTQACKHPHVKDVSRVHLGRGDVELMRLTLAWEGELPENLGNTNVQATLLKNAGTYYRGAANTAQVKMGSFSGASTNEQETWRAAEVRGTVAAALSVRSAASPHDGEAKLRMKLPDLTSKGISAADVMEELSKMVELSVLSEADARALAGD